MIVLLITAAETRRVDARMSHWVYLPCIVLRGPRGLLSLDLEVTVMELGFISGIPLGRSHS